MQRPLLRILIASVLVIIAGYTFLRGLDTGGRMSVGYEVGAIASYPSATWGQSNLTLVLGFGGVGTLLALMLLLAWLIRSKPTWLVAVTGVLLVGAISALGWGLAQSGSGTIHLDSAVYQDDTYQLSVWRGGAPGAWQVWQCAGSDCTVIQSIDVRNDVEGLSRQASTYPARLEVEGDRLLVVIDNDEGDEVRVPVNPSS
jgi:hypothetical protein